MDTFSPRLALYLSPFVLAAVSVLAIFFSRSTGQGVLISMTTSFACTYFLTQVERAHSNPSHKHIRHSILLYFLIAILLVSSFNELYLAFIPGSTPLAQEKMLTYEKQSADLAIKQIAVLLAAAITNLVGVFVFKIRQSVRK